MKSELANSTPKYCSECSAQTAAEDVFCQECGVTLPLEDGKQAASLVDKFLMFKDRVMNFRVTLPEIPGLPKLPESATPVLGLCAAAVLVPWCVQSIDKSYDSMSEDYIAGAAEKAFKRHSIGEAAELLLRLHMERPTKLSKEHINMLGMCLMLRSGEAIQVKDYTTAMMYLHDVTNDCPQYAAAQAQIKDLERQGLTTTAGVIPSGVVPGMPAAAPAGTPVAVPAAPGQPVAGAAVVPGTPAVVAVPAVAGTAAAPGVKNNSANAPDAVSNAAGTPAVTAKANQNAQAPSPAFALPPLMLTLSQQANAALAPATPHEEIKPVESSEALKMRALENATPSAAAFPASRGTINSEASATTATTPQAVRGKAQSEASTSNNQSTVPIWQQISHGGSTGQPHAEDKKKTAANSSQAKVAAEPTKAGSHQEAASKSGFFIDGKEISRESGMQTSERNAESGKRSGQRSQSSEGPKSYNPDDISRYNELLANYFRQHDAEGSNSKETVGTEPPSFQEWVSKGKTGFR